jgi:PAS domain S-box-containing protein
LSSDWYWEQDKNLRFTRMSKPDTRQSGVELNTFLGHARRDAPGIVWDEPELTQLEAITAARQPFRDFEIGRVYRNGPKHYVRMSGEPMFDASGAFKGYRGVGSDITGRKRAESDLRAAEEQFRSLVEHSLAGIYILQDGRYAYVNPRFAEVLGYGSAAELLAVDPLATAPASDHATILERRRSVLEGKAPSFHYLRTAIRKDGTSIDLDVIGTIATHEGRPALVGMVQDVSEKKRAEEQIQRHIVQLEAAFMRTVEVAATLSEMRDPYTAGHERRVAEIAAAIGAELGLDGRKLEGLRAFCTISARSPFRRKSSPSRAN